MQLLRTIAIIVLVWYGFKMLTRYVFPFLLKRFVDKKMEQFQQQGQNQGQAGFNNEKQAKEFAKQHEGEVKIKSAPHKTETEGFGEEVDFEEVD